MKLRISVWTALFAAALIVASILGIYALTTFSRDYSWTMENTSFVVRDAIGGVLLEPTASFNLGTVSSFSTFHYDWYVYNTGNVPITITVQETGVTTVATWNSKSEVIAVGAYFLFTLDLANFSAGSYSFSFQSASS